MKTAHVVGARPQFIKCTPVSRAIQRMSEMSGSPMENILIHTGQHYDYAMWPIFFREGAHRLSNNHGAFYGDGRAAGKIIMTLNEIFNRKRR